MTLKNPFPSSPKNPPRHVIYIGLHNVICLGATYSAHRLVVGYCLKDREYRWINDTTVMTSDSLIKIRTDTLKEIIEYRPTKEEEEWLVPEPHHSLWLGLARKTNKSPTETKDKEKVVKKRQAAEEQPRPRPQNPDTRSIGDIAQSLGIKPSEARAILRAQKISKPYAWNNSDANNIEKLLQKHRKK